MMGGWDMGVGGWIWMLVVPVALVAVVWLLARAAQYPTRADDALATLRGRFARGEISEEEFEKTRRLLGA